MARPSSRAGIGMGGYGPPPGTGMARMGTGQRPIGTGMAPGTAMRLQTGQQGPVFAGVGMATEVKVSERPVTQQGMRGISTAGAGPGRQVQDNSYYTGLLRGKITEMNGEIQKFKRDIDRFQKDNSQYAALERRYEELIKEVRDLEGQLADYNLAMDKSRAGTDVGEIEHYFNMLREKNQSDAAGVDEVFLQKKQRMANVAAMEGEMERLTQQAADKMNAMAPDKLARYRQLTSENAGLVEKVKAGRSELMGLNQQIGTLEATLREDRWRDEAYQLEKEVARLRKEKASLEAEASTSQMDPAQARVKLLAKVKEDNARIGQVDSQLAAATAELETQRKALSELQGELEERKNNGGDSQKYEVLFQRDSQMSQFIDAFPETKARALEDQKQAEGMIVGLLEHISRNIAREESMPSQRAANEQKEELSFKARQLQTSQTTQSRLQAELEKRKSELDKINTLDSKITVELGSLNNKINSMQEEAVVFSDIDTLRETADNTRRLLLQYKQQYSRRRDSVKRQVGQLSGRYEKLKNRVSESEISKAHAALQQKLRNHEQDIFHLQEYIDAKEKETDYRAMREACSRITDDLNALVIEAQARANTMAVPLSNGSGY